MLLLAKNDDDVNIKINLYTKGQVSNKNTSEEKRWRKIQVVFSLSMNSFERKSMKRIFVRNTRTKFDAVQMTESFGRGACAHATRNRTDTFLSTTLFRCTHGSTTWPLKFFGLR